MKPGTGEYNFNYAHCAGCAFSEKRGNDVKILVLCEASSLAVILYCLWQLYYRIETVL
jgi:hypothetical protein